VFIAVITETFAEIRVQFSEMWQSREMPQHEDANQTVGGVGIIWDISMKIILIIPYINN
jgi:hypothetical protein